MTETSGALGRCGNSRRKPIAMKTRTHLLKLAEGLLLSTSLLRSVESHAAGPVLREPAYTNGQFSFVLNGESKAGYAILTSDDLIGWKPIFTNYDNASARKIASPAFSDRGFFEVRRMPMPLFLFALAVWTQIDLDWLQTAPSTLAATT